jgi:ribosomal protein S18 acetylase RimI-like enzyme
VIVRQATATFTIVPYTPDLAPAVAEAYNALIRPVPHCHPADANTMHAALAAAGNEWRHAERVFVALKGGVALGFVHTALGRHRHRAAEESGLIRFLGYRAGQRAAGQALLECAEGTLRAQGQARAIAFAQRHRYPFYHLGSAYLSDRLGHVAALLGMNGYARTAGEVYLDWRDLPLLDPAPARIEAQIAVEWLPGAGRLPGLAVRARRGGAELGVCMCVSCAEYNAAGADQEWAFTKWIGVADEAQGRGLGKHLLQRALRELQQVGYRHAAISTALHNHRAALFYSNLGYRVVDWTYGYERRLD